MSQHTDSGAVGDLRHLFAEWAALPVWKTRASRFARCRLEIRPRPGFESTGFAQRVGRGWLIVVRSGYSMADARATLLHEMAHVAAGWGYRNMHGREWRALFLLAAMQVVGGAVNVPNGYVPAWVVIHLAIRDALQEQRQARA